MAGSPRVFSSQLTCHTRLTISVSLTDPMLCGHTHCTLPARVRNNNNKASDSSVPFSLCHLCCEMDPSWQPRTGAAQRRRGRRLRAAWRHEQQSIVQAVAVATHHSPLRRHKTATAEATNNALRSQKTSVAGDAEFFSLYEEELGGTRPDRLAGVRPLVRVLQRTVGQIVASAGGHAAPRR